MPRHPPCTRAPSPERPSAGRAAAPPGVGDPRPARPAPLGRKKTTRPVWNIIYLEYDVLKIKYIYIYHDMYTHISYLQQIICIIYISWFFVEEIIHIIWNIIWTYCWTSYVWLSSTAGIFYFFEIIWDIGLKII